MSRTRTIRNVAKWTGAAVAGLILLDLVASVATLAFGAWIVRR